MNRLPQLPNGADNVARPDLRSLLVDEYRYRNDEKFFGSWDMLLAAKSVLAIGIAEAFQQDLDAHPDLRGGKDPFTLMAEAPWDWKAVAVSVGVFAVGSAAGRINQRNRLDAEIAEAAQQVREGATLNPYSAQEVKRNRLLTKAKRGILTAAGCAVAYKVGEHGTLSQDLIAESGLIAGAVASIAVVNARSKRKINRILYGDQKGTDIVPADDYIDGRVAYDEDRGLPQPHTNQKRRLNP